MEDRLLTKEEVCEWLNISRATLDRWRNQGLPYLKTGKLVRFNRGKVQEWLNQQTHNQK
ncbi:DNA-binding protein, excisionase family [Desulfosporosinus acidiphilus SJ4]|uniref:DNA-binding protein, excisionase family n=1 Tax=Desulfosporosinus acidiphilus (strain DSM 22704 / JCM 16185 / SJ4) TaxID=646529 RepID=I4D5A4_DESAJ|nr:helix-turn-helix domain-containing protein [Desulfosporosinus acidiphilus]AFM40978.1 DNA-binding protein, excisionase family [Desulfosporosinus acidiphilus SJ4]